MSLNVYTGRKYVPKGMEVIDLISPYFNTQVKITECDMVKRVLKDVDGSEWVNERVFQSRFKWMGNVAFSNMSNGGKTVLCVYYHKDKCFNIRSCADNAAEFLWKLTDGNVLVPYLVSFYGEACDIVVNGDKRFFDLDELWEYLDENSDLFDGWNNGRS